MDSHYIKLNNGTYGFARWIKSRKKYRLYYLYPNGSKIAGSYFSSEVVQRFRRLKNKPSSSALKKAGWGF